MNQEKLDRIIKQQLMYWVIATGFATAFALFAKLIWTANFPILIMLPLGMIGFALASIGTIRRELSPLVSEDSTADA